MSTGPILTAADAVSLSRLVLAGVFAISQGAVTRLALIAVAGITDYIDGWVARRNAPGRYGALIDPAADRVFIIVVVGTLLGEGLVSLRECIVFLARDIVTTFGALVVRLVPSIRGARLRARPSGKVVTALQFVALIGIIAEPASVRWLLPTVAVATLISVVDYGAAIWRGRARP
jgi:phosphatidylglycerophosphate synthase